VTFEEFAATRLTPILAFAAVLTGQRAAAEDITQEVLIRAYAKWDTIGSLDKPEFVFTALPGASRAGLVSGLGL
jgi:DNA-directed RNA polymerase specialized sigma24 family protein